MALKNTSTGFPRKDIPDSKKDKSYDLRWAKAIESAIKGNRSGIDDSQRDWFALMRLYGQGNQPEYLYKDYEFGRTTAPNTGDVLDSGNVTPSKGDREGFNHIDYTPISIMPRIKDKLKGLLSNIDYIVSVDTIDERSGAEKDKLKFDLMIEREYGDFIHQFEKNAGLPSKKYDFVPRSDLELELYDQVGGFKLHIAKDMEKLIQHTFEISDWDGELRDACIDDLTDFGYGIMQVYLDKEDGKWKLKYVDPIDAILPYMRKNEFHDMPYAGHYEWMTIADLRQHLDVKEDELAVLAKRFCGLYDNPSNSRWDSLSKISDDGSYGYDTFKVKVMHIEWIDESKKHTMYYKNKYGKQTAFRLKEGEEVKPLDENRKSKGVDQQIEVTNYRVLRKASWLVDSDYIYDNGLANFIDRPIKNKVLPNYIVIRLTNKSITERLKPVMDDIMVSWLKYQDARAMAIQAGYAIDFSMLSNIEDGGKKYSMLDILKMWRDTGILIFQGSLSGKYEGGAVTPIMPINSTTGQALQEANDMWRLAMQKIEDISGLSPVALGALPTGETATGTEISTASTADILKPLIKKVLTLKEKSARSLMRRIQMFCKGDNLDVYEPLIGKVALQRLKSSSKTPVQFGMSFEAKPTEQEKQQLIAIIEASMNNRRNGQSGISLSDGAWAIEQINHGGNLKQIRVILAYQESKHQEQLDEQKNKAIELQGQQNQALKEMENQTKQMELQAEMAKIQAEGKMKLENTQAQTLGDILKDYLKERPEEAKAYVMGQQAKSQIASMPNEDQGWQIEQ